MQAFEENRLCALNAIADERGLLVAIEGRKDVPFPIARVYTIIGKAGHSRGFHAHRELDQMLVCLSGSCRILVDDGREQRDWQLDTAAIGLRVRPMEWHEMHDFSDGAVLMVLASNHYDECDYIRNYDEFLAAEANRADPRP